MGVVHAVLFASLLIGAQTRLAVAEPGRPSQEAEKGLRTITGVVTDPSGAVLPRVELKVRDADGRLVMSYFTNARGEFDLHLAEGSYTVVASLAGFAPLLDYHLAVSRDNPPLALTLELPSIGNQIVVTANRVETPLPQVGSSVTAISGNTLNREGVTLLADGLRRVAGITLLQSGGAGQLTSLFLRGGNSDYTKVYLDGIPLNDPGGAYNFADLSTSGIDRVEVVRGPQSALFGTDAISGVIQIFSRRGTSDGLRPAPGAVVEGGTFSTLRFGGSVQGSDERVDYLASFSRFDTDNDVQNGSFNNATGLVNLGYRPSRRVELRAVFRSEAGRAGVPGPWAFLPPDPDEYYRHRSLAGGFVISHSVSPAWSQKLSYTVHDSRQFSEDPSGSWTSVPQYGDRTGLYPYSDFAYQFLNQTRRQAIHYQSDLTLPGSHLMVAGAEYERESGTIDSFDPTLGPIRPVRTNYAAYAEDQWAFRNRLFTAIGARLEHNASFGFFAAPRAAVAWQARQPSPGGLWGLTKLKASYGMGIKAPSLVQSFSNSPYFPGNPDLLAEKSISYDAGVEQRFGNDSGSVEVNYFAGHYRDQIGFAITDYTTLAGKYFNIGKSRARGVEILARQQLIGHLEIGGGYTFLDSRVLVSVSPLDPVYAAGQPLFRRPRNSGYADISWKSGRWTVGASGIFVGPRADSDFVGLGLTRSPGYGILNLLASMRLGNKGSVFLSVQNAANNHYMEVLGYPALRANFRVGLRAGF